MQYVVLVCSITYIHRYDGDSEDQAVGLPSSSRVQGLCLPLRSAGERGGERAGREREVCGHSDAVRRHQQRLAAWEDQGKALLYDNIFVHCYTAQQGIIHNIIYICSCTNGLNYCIDFKSTTSV